MIWIRYRFLLALGSLIQLADDFRQSVFRPLAGGMPTIWNAKY